MSGDRVPDLEIWRVYLPEYLIVYTSRAFGAAGVQECGRWFDENYKGKVLDTHQQIESFLIGLPEHHPEYANRPIRLKVRLYNLRGEYVERTDAERLVEELGPDAVIVARYSREDRKLRDYGKRKLAS